MNEALIVEAVRSPIGKKNGTLAGTRADDLAAMVLSGLVERAGVDKDAIEDVVMGCVTQIGEQGFNIGRTASLIAGLPVETAATSVNRMCASSLQSTNFQAQAIMSGQLDVGIAAGVEVMSRTQMGSDNNNVGMSEKLTDKYAIIPQGFSAEMIAEQWKFSREELDEYSFNSHQRAVKAQEAGYFDAEILPLDVTKFDGEEVTFDRDETPRGTTTLEKMGTLNPAFKPDGVVTAGNSSQISDGSAALLMMSGEAAAKHGVKARAKVISTALSGVDPTIMLTGNPTAMKKALDRVGLKLSDMAVIEVNEAFATVALQSVKDLGLEDRMDDFNPNGGGISLGHPLGASGARILTSLVAELERRDARYGIASMCIGFGMACATVVERVK